MARPRRCAAEAVLLRAAVAELGATGSMRSQAAAVAIAVAKVAVASLRGADDLDALLDTAASRLVGSAVALLATDAAIGVEALAIGEAVKAFEARGCRHVPADQWPRADEELRMAVQSRLLERYRKALK